MSNNKEGNQSTPKHQVDTADFLAFSDSPTSTTDFCPSNSSSPQKYWKQTPRNNYQKNWNNSRFSGNSYNNSYGSPKDKNRNRSFNGPYENNYQQKRYDSPNRSFNSSFNSTYNKSWSRNSSFNNSKNTTDGGVNILNYLHPSFMEDPWAKLEHQRMCKAEEMNAPVVDASSDDIVET